MRDSCFRISLDIHKVQSQVSLPIKLGDTARRIYITLTEGGKPFEIGNDCVAIFSALKADDNRIFNDCIIEDNRIRYDITAQTVSTEGIVNAEIILYGSDEAVLASPRFDLVVDDRVAGVATISEEEMNFFDSFILSEQSRVANEQRRIEEFNNLGLFVEDNGDNYKLTKTNKDGSKKEFLIAKGKNGKDYVITSSDYKAIADKVVTDTLDAQAEEYFGKLDSQYAENIENFKDEINEQYVENIENLKDEINEQYAENIENLKDEINEHLESASSAHSEHIDNYLKTATYTQEEINTLVSTIPKFSIEVVSALPTSDISSTTVYLLPSSSEDSNLYTEYIYVNDVWEILGTQKVDLSGYYDKSETDARFEELETVLGNLEDLNTTSNETIVDAVNEALAHGGADTIGTLSSLATTDKSNLVNAVNELATDKADFIDATTSVAVGSFTNGSLTDYTIPETGWYYFQTTNTAVNDAIRISVGGRAMYLSVYNSPLLPLKQGTVIKIGGTTTNPIAVFRLA